MADRPLNTDDDRGEDRAPADLVGDAGADGPPPGGDAEAGYDPTSSILPVILISVNKQPITAAVNTKGTLRLIIDHDGTLKNLAKRPVALTSPIQINVRGRTSQGYAKQQFSVEFDDDAGNDKKVALLGLPAGSDWVLHSCYADKTCLRNALAYSIGNELGRWTPHTRFVEVFIDDDYRGLYVLVEKIRVDKHRVDIPKLPAAGEAGDTTGGFIIHSEASGEGVPTDKVLKDWGSALSGRVYSYLYPRYDQITTDQKTYIQAQVSKFEQAMKASTWADPTKGFLRYIDLPSWVDDTLVQETTNNVDGYVTSVYMQKWPDTVTDGRAGKWVMGPYWDFDIAFGNADFRDGARWDVWGHTMGRFGTFATPYMPPGQVTFVSFYWEKLWTDPGFKNALKCRWTELRKGPLDGARLNARIDGWVKQLAVVQPRDQAKWQNIGKKVFANPYVGATYADEIAYLRMWLNKRLTWMDANMPGTCPP